MLAVSFSDQAQYVLLIHPRANDFNCKGSLFLSSLVYKHSYLLINVSLNHITLNTDLLCAQGKGCSAGKGERKSGGERPGKTP